MASISLPTMAIITAVGTAASAGVAAYGAREQGIQANRADQQKANIEKINQGQKQIDMRQKMLQQLAAQNAGTLGAIGTGQGTSFGASALRQITQAQNDLAVTNANEGAQVSLLDQAGASASAAGSLGAASDVLGGATKIAGMNNL